VKTTITKFICLALLLGYSYTLSAHVTLDSPVGGETFTIGQTVTITWHITIPHNTLNWDLLFSPDGGATWEYIYQDLPVGNSSYQWTVPSTLTSQGRVSVIQDNSAQDYQDESNNFTIQAAPVPPAIVMGATAIVIESNTSTQDAAIQAWLDNHGGASANNFCGTLNWTDDYSGISNECGVTGSALVTFTAADQCGSTATSATLTIVDSTPPALGIPASDLQVECDGNGNTLALNTWLSSAGNAMAADDGSNVTWTNTYSGLSNGCGMTGNTLVIFTATDACGNSLTTSATFTIADHLAPAISVAAQGTTIVCGQPGTQTEVQNWLNTHGGAVANDQCGSVSWTNNFPVLPDTCSHTTSWPVTFTAMDECGNTSTTSAALTLLGTSGTSGPAPADLAFTISPNPVHQTLLVTFENPTTNAVRLSLFDAYGQLMVSYTETAGTLTIPVSAYTPGIYFLRAETTRGVYSRKLLIE
jgi:hypothetical protein